MLRKKPIRPYKLAYLYIFIIIIISIIIIIINHINYIILLFQKLNDNTSLLVYLKLYFLTYLGNFLVYVEILF